MDRSLTCCFSGHRNIPAEQARWLAKRLDDAITYLYGKGVKSYLTGGALGFDTLAANAVLAQRMKHIDISLTVVIPCKDQDRKWGWDSRRQYHRILDAADEVHCLAEQYYSGCMQVRNHYMVDHSGVCICYLLRPYGGTYSTVRYARECGISVFNLAKRPRK